MSPTGYTADLYDGKEVSFPEFALKCSRAFGATILMRDEPLDADIPDEFTPSDYHVREIEKAKTRLAEAKSWTDREADAHADHAYEKDVERKRELEEGQAARRERYEAMLTQVEAWNPPTSEHQGLKDFMRQQLEESIKFDTGYEQREPVRLSADEFRAEAIAKAERDIAYHEKEDREERERAAGRTAWVRALKDSLQEEAITA